MKDNITYPNRGYTLLFAIIVSSVALSIAVFILSTSRKQFILSSFSRDSVSALYAADSAIECAINSYFTDQLATSTDGISRNASISCQDTTLSSGYVVITPSDTSMGLQSGQVGGTGSDFLVYQISAPIKFSFADGTCARIIVTDGYDSTTFKHKTIIDSRGYNDGNSRPCNSSGPDNRRQVERAIRLIYND